jgi:hypothetical protein
MEVYVVEETDYEGKPLAAYYLFKNKRNALKEAHKLAQNYINIFPENIKYFEGDYDGTYNEEDEDDNCDSSIIIEYNKLGNYVWYGVYGNILYEINVINEILNDECECFEENPFEELNGHK